jgi:hypothetical protein
VLFWDSGPGSYVSAEGRDVCLFVADSFNQLDLIRPPEALFIVSGRGFGSRSERSAAPACKVSAPDLYHHGRCFSMRGALQTQNQPCYKKSTKPVIIGLFIHNYYFRNKHAG